MTAPRRVVEPAGRQPPGVLAVAVVLLLVVLVWRVVQHYRAGDAAASASGTAGAAKALPAASSPPAAPATSPAASPPAAPRVEAPVPPAAVAQPPARAPVAGPITLPYRYMGSTGSGPDAEFVFFGRGRTVTLRGPGALDDEYVIEWLGEQQLQWRHLPTGTSQFIALAVRPAVPAAPARPEDFPRD